MSLSYIWHRVRHVFHSSETLCWLHYSECGRSLQSLERGVQKPHAGSVSRTFSCLSARVHTSLGSSSLKRVRWLQHLLKSGIPSRTPPPRGPPEAAAPPGPMGGLSRQHQLPAHSLSSPPSHRDLASSSEWQWGRNQKTVMVQSRKGFVFVLICLPLLPGRSQRTQNPSCFTFSIPQVCSTRRLRDPFQT